MKALQLADVISSLATRAAADLETQNLEFKGWCRDERDLSAVVSEAVVCLANSDGGLVVVGVDDKGTGSAAIRQCPHAAVTPDWLRKRMRDLTRPPVPCTVVRVGDVLPQTQGTPAADLLVVEVSKTTNPTGHRTNRGVSFIRVDTECRAEYLVDNDDYSAVWLDHVEVPGALDEHALKTAVAARRAAFPALTDLGDNTLGHLSAAGLVRSRETVPAPTRPSYAASLAALLLFGKEARIKGELPAAETVLCVETTGLSPLTSSNWYNVVDALQRYLRAIHERIGVQESAVPPEAIRELLLNAYLHRCYRTTGPVQVRIAPGEIEIRNPGGLLGDLTPGNLLYAPPIYRNFALADGARQFGLCEKAGTGLDKVFKQLMVEGLDFPYIEASGNSFKAIIKTKRDKAFARFVRDCSGTLQLTLTELVVLRVLRSRSKAPAELLAVKAQRPLDYVDDVLRDLERRNLIRRGANHYRLSDSTAERLAMYDDEGQLRLL